MGDELKVNKFERAVTVCQVVTGDLILTISDFIVLAVTAKEVYKNATSLFNNLIQLTK